MKETSDEEQNQIFRKMTPLQKVRLVDDFFKFGQKLQKRANPEVVIAIDDYDLGQE